MLHSRDANGVIQRLKVLLALLIALSMGPYISGSVRLEHLAIYPLAVVSGLIFFTQYQFCVSRRLGIVLGFFSFLFFWTFIGHVAQHGLSDISLGAIENYLQPLAILLIIETFARRLSNDSLRQLIITVAWTVVFVHAANAVVAIANLTGTLRPFVDQYFVRGVTESGLSVWQNSAVMGRYPGVYGQPFEAGIGYSAAALSWVYLLQSRQFGLLMLAFGILVVVGGVISISKVFLLIGIPLSIVSLIVGFKTKHFFWNVVPVLIVIGFVFAGIGWVSNNWDGLDYMLRLFDARHYQEGQMMQTIFAGRVGNEASGAAFGVNIALSDSPFAGFGFVVPFQALDSAYTESIFRGGIPALICFSALNVYLLALGLKWKSKGPEFLLMLLLILLLVGAAFGGPTFTVNRASVPLLILIGLFLLLGKRSEFTLTPVHFSAGK